MYSLAAKKAGAGEAEDPWGCARQLKLRKNNWFGRVFLETGLKMMRSKQPGWYGVQKKPLQERFFL